jgi:hypothetical protein
LETKLEKPDHNDPLYLECLKKAEGEELRALAIYQHKKSSSNQQPEEDLDQREKWPMLAPLLILYTLGTIGVLALVFGFLGNRLNWW